MADIVGHPMIHGFINHLMNGEITLLTGLFWLAIAGLLSFVGGAIGGMILAGKELGYQLAAMIGSLLGPAGAIPVAAIGLVVLKLI